jgi:hypothetical protein
MTPQIFSAKVTKVQPHLGAGFISTAYVFLTEYEGQKVVHVYNGDYGIRELTQDQARECLTLGSKLNAEENKKVYDRYFFELNR